MAEADYQIEQEIIELAHEWIDAVGRRDSAVLDRLIADDFLISGWLPDGRSAGKKLYVEDCLRPVEVEQASYSFERWNIRAYDDTAVVNCILHCHALITGQDWGGDFLLTDVWVRQGGHWRVVSRHSSPLVTATIEKCE
jgi:ketosteroid isomerase-like protein